MFDALHTNILLLLMRWLATDKVYLSLFPIGGAAPPISFLVFCQGTMMEDHTRDYYCDFVGLLVLMFSLMFISLLAFWL